jgi:integrase
MPTIAKGPRLWFQPARYDKTGKLKENAAWVIRDGSLKRGTGCALGDRKEAERQLAEYIQSKHIAPRTRDRDPSEIKIADVLAIYATDKVARQAIPKEVLGRIERLALFFGERVLADMSGSLCRAYVEYRKGAGAARRELEDLRAAINYHFKEGYCTLPIPVTLPEKGRPRERWLTRSEAARLLWAAWRMTQKWKGRESERRTGRHVARFILVGLYTGTRAGAICGASFVPREDSGYVDLDRGVFYRRAALARQTKKRQPPVPIPDRLLVHMRRWRDRRISHQFVVEWNGDPVARVNKAFASACKRAGLGADVTPHTLRHTAATWMMQNGVEAWEAAGFLGMTTDILQSTYGHHSPDHLEGARNGISARQLPDRMTGNIGGNKREREGAKNVFRLRA